MTIDLSTGLAIYAAVLSTILAVLNLVKFKRDSDKEKVKLSAELIKKNEFEKLVSGMYSEPVEPYPPVESATLYEVKVLNRSDFPIKLDTVKIHSDLGDFSAYKKYSIGGQPNYHSPIGEEFKVDVPSKEYRKFGVVIPKGSENLKVQRITLSTVCGKVVTIKT
ncbi:MULTISPECIES: hypothetical protein [Shewanella]|uniref:DUF4352 domain-containing protein n=1 Tax=Shewanella marisflavi TaxID=260364 RepID=A0ABX5WMN1_9GAMM|nr:MULTISPECIES: hypothetical protein [Shewanella]QDF75529.1 hypothetical protein FGA12_10415 [Shewanella marisflavi]